MLLRLLIMPFLLSRIVGWWRLWLAWRPDFGRSNAFWLRTLNGHRIQRPLLRLVPIGLVSAIRLLCGHTIRLRWFGVLTGAVRLRLMIRRRPLWASGIVLWMRGRRIGCWLNCGTIHRSVIRRPCLFCAHNGAVAERPRLRSSSDWWCAMVQGSPLLRVSAGSVRMLRLSGHRRNMPLACHGLFLRCWTRTDATVAAVVADAVDLWCC